MNDRLPHQGVDNSTFNILVPKISFSHVNKVWKRIKETEKVATLEGDMSTSLVFYIGHLSNISTGYG